MANSPRRLAPGKLTPVTGQLILGVVILALLAGLLLAPQGEGLPGEGAFPIVGQPAPDFSLHGPSGEWRLADHLGKPVILAFWTTWCGVCLKDLDVLEGFHRRYGGQVEVVGVCPERWVDLPRILAEHPVSFPILYDPQGRVTSRYQLFENLRFPFTVFVDATGRVTGAWAAGLRDLNFLSELLAKSGIHPG
ncbi:MAG: Thiol:disulfide interchange protein DsbE [Acetothermia bacterium 64_32]|nr:MAG: Thiol:disulfide interchange protein DsbE [Acetothermia bacterium 64_32]